MWAIRHLFLKDLRCLSGHVLMLLAVVAGSAVFEIRAHLQSVSGVPDGALYLLLWILPFAWLFVIAGVVQQEPLPGTKQYWITRPIPHWALLAEKIAFVALWVNFVWFLSDCAILAALGLPIHPLALLLRQIPLTMLFFLPVLCLASVTKSLGQIALGLIGCALLMILEMTLPNLLNRGEVTTSIGFFTPLSFDFVRLSLTMLSVLALSLQFLRRATAVSRVLLGLSFLFIPFVLLMTIAEGSDPFMFAQENLHPNGKLVLDFASGRHPRPVSADGFGGLQLPVRIEGLPSKLYAEGSGTSILSSPLGSEIKTTRRASLHDDGTGYWLRLTQEKGEGWQLRGNIQSSMRLSFFEILSQKQVRLDEKKPFSLATGEVCRPLRDFALFQCWQGPIIRNRTALRAFADLDGDQVELNNGHAEMETASWAFSPLTDWIFSRMRTYPSAFKPSSTVRFVNMKFAGSTESSVKADDVDLLAYLVKP